jgi:hypothetical protein
MGLIVEPSRPATQQCTLHVQGGHISDENAHKTHLYWAEECRSKHDRAYLKVEGCACGTDVRPSDVCLIGEARLTKNRVGYPINLN